jgi:PKD repeat protein
VVKKKFLMGIILVAMVVSISIADATSSQAPFITIDPIGNHTIGDVFFINGTTNLAVFNESLSLDISTVNINPGGWGPEFRSTVSVQPGEHGINTWSCNATVGPGWSVYPPQPGESISESVSESVGTGQDEVRVYVGSSGTDTIAEQTFFLFPSESRIQESHTPPVASFGYIADSGTTPLTIQFADTSTNTPTAWLWSFGDGGSATSRNPSHTYAGAGIYTVKLTVKNAAGSNTTSASLNLPAYDESTQSLLVPQKTTPSASLPAAMPTLVLAAMVTLSSVFRKKRD